MFASPRDQSKHPVIVPVVDVSSLDLVGVVVAAEAGSGDRGVIEAGALASSGASPDAAPGASPDAAPGADTGRTR